MDDWDTETRICRYHVLESVYLEQKDYRPTFGGTIMRLVNNFPETALVARTPYHRNPSVRSQETIAAVAAAIQANPRVLKRSLSAQMGISRQSLQTIMQQDLNLFPYKIQLTSKLNTADLLCSRLRLEFYQKIIRMVEEDENVLKCIFMSDETHFDLNGKVNNQNCQI